MTVVDLEIAAREAVCQALATLPALQEGDLQTFYDRAQRMLELLPEGSAFILADSRGQQLVNTNRPYGASLPVRGDLTSVRKVFETRQRWLSDVFMGAVSQEPVVGLDIPVFRNGDVIYELALSLPISNLRDILTAQRLPEGWVAAVLDRQGTVIARTRDNEAWVGKKAAAPLRKDMSERRQGLSGGRTLEGVDVISAFTTSPQTNWTVAIGRPQAEITDPLRRRILLLMAIIAAVVTLGILLTALLGRQVAVPIAALARNAASLSRGEAVRPVASPIREIAHVGAALSAAAAELREREAAVQAAVDRAEAVAAERAAVLGQLAEGVIATDPQGRISFVNEAAARIHGVVRLDVPLDQYSDSYRLFTEDGRPYPSQELPLARAVLKHETVVDERWRIRRPDGTEVLAVGSARPVTAADGTHVGAVLTLRDDTMRDAAERRLREINTTLEQRVNERTRELVATNESLQTEIRNREQAESQIRQMQKIEAVGQLTGGIAHDFNNMLAIIIGSLRLLQKRLERGETDVQRFIDGAVDGAERAAALTRRLLAFSRQQTLVPQPLDGNKLIAGMSDFLRRTIPENVELETVLAGGLWRAHADPHQLESTILNLAVNGRDAMPGGGKLTIETANAWLDEVYASSHADVAAGQYVMIAVTDTGTGMPANVAARAFDPFFTTKPPGQGTGLGLSQVYGFIKQSGGHVKIYSEEGQGTTVKIYLPCHVGEGADLAVERALPPMPMAAANEKILLVEDEERVRSLTSEMLRDLGYRVIEADGAARALKLLEKNPDVTLLFTDIMMAGVNGRQLADEAVARHPELKVLFATGYTRNAIVHNGILDAGVSVIMKPYTMEALASKVSEVLWLPPK